MIIALMIALVIFDLVVMAALYSMYSKRNDGDHVLREITEERQMLMELRRSVQEELEMAAARNRDYLDRVTRIATEAEQEVRNGSETIAKEVDTLAKTISGRFNEPLAELNKRQSAIEALLRRLDKDKRELQNTVNRAERLSQFFDNRVPYQEVLSEIEDKKYMDARQMLASGTAPEDVARQLGMSPSEVRMLIGFATP